MKKIRCEICGYTNIIKENGLFVCQNCGVKYTLAEAKSLLCEVGDNSNLEVTDSKDNTNISTKPEPDNTSIQSDTSTDRSNVTNDNSSSSPDKTLQEYKYSNAKQNAQKYEENIELKTSNSNSDDGTKIDGSYILHIINNYQEDPTYEHLQRFLFAIKEVVFLVSYFTSNVENVNSEALVYKLYPEEFENARRNHHKFTVPDIRLAGAVALFTGTDQITSDIYDDNNDPHFSLEQKTVKDIIDYLSSTENCIQDIVINPFSDNIVINVNEAIKVFADDKINDDHPKNASEINHLQADITDIEKGNNDASVTSDDNTFKKLITQIRNNPTEEERLKILKEIKEYIRNEKIYCQFYVCPFEKLKDDDDEFAKAYPLLASKAINQHDVFSVPVYSGQVILLYTSVSECPINNNFQLAKTNFSEILQAILGSQNKIEGVVVNPYSDSYNLTAEYLGKILNGID